MAAAAELAAAALLDTLELCARCLRPDQCHLALAGTSRRRREGELVSELLTAGRSPPARRRRSARASPTPTRTLAALARPSCRSAWTPRSSSRGSCTRGRAGLDERDAVLGPAEDGGWWVLAPAVDPTRGAVCAAYPCPPSGRSADTRRALTAPA